MTRAKLGQRYGHQPEKRDCRDSPNHPERVVAPPVLSPTAASRRRMKRIRTGRRAILLAECSQSAAAGVRPAGTRGPQKAEEWRQKGLRIGDTLMALVVWPSPRSSPTQHRRWTAFVN